VIPDHLRYTAEHEWVEQVDGGRVRIGITHYAQDALGDVVFVSLPEPGATVSAGESLGEVESTKSVSEVYAPLAGEVVARNDALESRPELVNADPYGEGWIVEIAPSDADAVNGLLDAAAYQQLTESSS
jgi:glycine cleavage system H protein